MFAKATAIFFALIVFVNAAPIVDHTMNPGVHPLHQIRTSHGGHKPLPVNYKRDQMFDHLLDILHQKFPSIKRENFVDLDLDQVQPVVSKRNIWDDLERAFQKVFNRGFDSDTDFDPVLPAHKRDGSEIDYSVSQNPSSDQEQTADEVNSLITHYKDTLAALNANNRLVGARDLGLDLFAEVDHRIEPVAFKRDQMFDHLLDMLHQKFPSIKREHFAELDFDSNADFYQIQPVASKRAWDLGFKDLVDRLTKIGSKFVGRGFDSDADFDLVLPGRKRENVKIGTTVPQNPSSGQGQTADGVNEALRKYRQIPALVR